MPTTTVHSSQIAGIEDISPAIMEFIDLTKQVKTAKEQIKLLNERRNELEASIRERMKTYQITAFTTAEGNVRVYESKSVKAPSKDDVVDLIAEKVGNEKLAQEVVGIIYDKANRASTSTEKIKVIPKRATPNA
jgi:vacuolar-type H+-ATPase subunit D/Vma8